MPMRQVNMREAKTHLSRLVQVIALNDPHQSDRCVLRRALLQGGWQELLIEARQVLAGYPGPVRWMPA
ncbi:MAG: hypothetical protein VKM92_08510 [Cyanobacteriota bacterium]|nr:hypothetical protein [Cyanobacteriota bacterium]